MTGFVGGDDFDSVAVVAEPSYEVGMQIPLSHWPMGLCREIATINPRMVADNLGSRLAFERDHDDLDAYSAAVFVIDGVPFALQLYDHIPTRNCTLISMDDEADDGARLATFLNWSGMSHDAVEWRRPSVD